MKRHKWTDIKARTKAETRRRIESEAQHLWKIYTSLSFGRLAA